VDECVRGVEEEPGGKGKDGDGTEEEDQFLFSGAE